MPAERRTTQEAKILEILVRARGGWVAAPELARVALQYSRAIYSLRKLGLTIRNRVEIGTHGVRHGFFRLIGGIPAKMQAPAPKLPRPDALFSVDELERCAPPPEFPS